MTIHHPIPKRSTGLEPLPRPEADIDYQRLFAEPPPPAEAAPDALDGMREQDPDAYRMVIYSWA